MQILYFLCKRYMQILGTRVNSSPGVRAFHSFCVILLISVGGRYFLFLTLDKAVCPFLVKYFEMPIWHPTCEKALDEMLNAKVDR
jgi:hypothetical protein